MIETTKNNYYRPHGNKEQFAVEISGISRDPLSYGEELVLNAKELWDKKDGKLYCMYSGGIDSELLLEVFLSLGMDITPVITRLLPNYNSHDLKYAFEYCKKKSIEPLIVDVDIEKFISSNEILDVSKIVGPTAYQILPIIKTAMSLDGTVLTGSNEPYFRPEQDGEWHYIEKEYLCVWTRLYNSNKLIGTPSFHSWTPETLLSFSIDPQIDDLCNKRLPGKQGTFSSRSAVYNRMFPLRERQKYTGWEVLEKSEIFNHENMQYIINNQKLGDGIYRLPYHKLLNILWNKNEI